MATTLTSSYKYIGRSNAVGCDNGYKYYILLYAKESANKTTGDRTITVKQILACTNDSTFHNWDTTGKVTVDGKTAYSWSNARVPLESWSGSSSLTAGGVTYKRYTRLKEGSVTVNTFAEKTITLYSYWKMEDTNSAGWFPDNTPAELSASVTLSSIATASVPTLSDTTPQMGQTVTISTNRVSSALTHTLTYAFGTKTGTIATGVGASKSWTIPDLAAYCNNAVSGTLTITCKTYSGSTLVGTKSVTFTLSVQAPTVPAVSASSVNMGSSVTITTARKSSNFTHALTYSFGGSTGSIGTGVTTSKAWSVPLSLASKIPSATSGDCTITCNTYNGTKLVGTKTVALTLKVPNDSTTKPTFTYTLAPSPADAVLAEGFKTRVSLAGKYVKGRSKVVATFNAKSTYSTIAEYSLKVDGATKTATTGSITSAYIANSYGTLTVTLRVTDARGYYTEVTDSIKVLNWVKPYVDRVGSNNAIVCERQAVSTSVENTVDYDYLRIEAKRVYSPMAGENVLTGTGFTQGNLCTLRYCVKKVSDADYSGEWVNLIYSSDLTTDEYVGLALDANGDPIKLSKAHSYDVYLQIYDATDTGTPTYVTVPTDEVALHLGAGGKKAAFGKYAEKENALEVAWDIFDKYDTQLTNGVALYDSAAAFDPNTTMESLILTRVNTPVSDVYYYIHTTFREEKSETAKRTQLALPYQSDNPIAVRFYNNGWSDWNKAVRQSGETMDGNLTISNASPALFTNNSTTGNSLRTFNSDAGYGGLWDATSGSSILSYSFKDKKITTLRLDPSTIGAVSNKGDTIDGNLILNNSSGTQTAIYLYSGANDEFIANFYCNDNGNMGLFDSANSVPILRYNANSKKITAIALDASSVEKTVSITFNTTNTKSQSALVKYNPLVGACFIRLYFLPNVSMAAGTAYEIATINSAYAPTSRYALSHYAGKSAEAIIDSNGVITLTAHAAMSTGYNNYISGFWLL